MKRFLIILFIFGLSKAGFSLTSNDSLVSIAMIQYNEGSYNDAISTYDEIIASGYESSEIYYNKANAYFKLNDMPSAILFYEKARKLNPKDEDILYNLNVANSRIVDNIEQVPDIFLKVWWNNFYNMFSANDWSKITIGLFMITLFFAAIYFLSNRRFTKKIFFTIGSLFLIATIFSFVLSYQKFYYSIEHKEAIVFQPTITVKSSPNNNSVDLFVIHEGSKVYITDELDNWYEIRIANGSIGWLPKSATQLI